MKKKELAEFKKFLKLFPKIDLPITLSAEDSGTFSKKNDPIRIEFIEKYIDPEINNEENELLEYIPCFRIKPALDNIYALIYFRADLMNYEYILNIYDKEGKSIDQKIIGGLRSNGPLVTRAVTTISDDLNIYIVEGMTDAEDRLYNPKSS
ncbi:MAG: hypothetical protein AAGK97_01225, partial [Bacteroidota bacterium]